MFAYIYAPVGLILSLSVDTIAALSMSRLRPRPDKEERGKESHLQLPAHTVQYIGLPFLLYVIKVCAKSRDRISTNRIIASL